MRRRQSSAIFGTPDSDPRLRVGLIAHWLSGQAQGSIILDQAGYGIDLPMVGDAAKYTRRDNCIAGIVCVRNSVYAKGTATERLGGLSTGTVTAWVYPTASPSTYHTFFNCGNFASGPNDLFLGATGSGMTALIGDASGYSWLTNAGGAVPLNQWSHVAIRWDGSKLYAYRDGVQRGSVLTTRTPTISAYPPAIGYGEASSYSFGGTISEVRIYNRAISTEELTVLATPTYSPVKQSRRRSSISIASPPAVTVRALAALGVG